MELIHRLVGKELEPVEREVSCYHNSTKLIKVAQYQLQCQQCAYSTGPFDGHGWNHTDAHRKLEIDHNLAVIYSLLERK
jgi:hypothetical protein